MFSADARAADAQLVRQTNTTLTLPAELPSATGYAEQDALPPFTFRHPVCIVSPPGEKNRIFIVEKEGRIQVVSNLDSEPKKQVFLDVRAMLAANGNGQLVTDLEWGVLGLAFHPNFSQNGYFFVTYDFAVTENGRRVAFNRLSRFTVSKTDPNAADPASELPMITQRDLADNHNGGDLHFGPDGYLYYSMGDEGAGYDKFNNARFIDKDFFAAIYRLDVDHRPGSLAPNPHSQKSTTYPSAVNPGAYWIPADNPFINAQSHSGRTVDPKKIRTEIWATGLRNPWRFSFDPSTGQMFIGDVGQDLWEEVDIGVAGGDYGWSYYEGTHPGPRLNAKPPDVNCIPPIIEYPHPKVSSVGDFNGKCIIGGVVYRGSALTELFGTYIFGDYNLRRVWNIQKIGDKWVPKLLATGADPSAFGVDPRDGEVLLTDYSGGKIRKLVRTGTTGPRPPALLSQTGAFSDLATLTPNAGIVPYTPNVAFWSDYAVKQRWFSVPNTADKIVFNADGNWTFPTGSTWVKNFELEMRRGDPTSRRRIETRFLVKTADGSYGITYKWRPDQSDADLVPEIGQNETFDVTVNGTPQQQSWHYPSRTECITCHTSVAGVALGFNTPQLNGPGKFGNQIQAMSDAGYFSSVVSDVKQMPAYAPATDKAATLDWRARSYLAVNCVQCHQPGGAAEANWDARSTTPLAAANIINGTLVKEGNDSANRFVVPGDLQHSMLLQSLEISGPHRMPPLASTEHDPGAIQLITDWINSNPHQ